MIACRKQFTDTLLELAREDKDIIAVTTDARGSVTLGDYANALPEQFVECGIAEQDAVGISAGLAHSGKKVFCCGLWRTGCYPSFFARHCRSAHLPRHDRLSAFRLARHQEVGEVPG